MQRVKRRSEVALYVWDYFYIANVAPRNDEKAWQVIERATCRIRESETLLDPPTPVDVRIRNARRIRTAVRVAMQQIERLRVKPEQWVLDDLAHLAAVADHLIDVLAAHPIVLD
jgi:hypothetical protein